MARKFLDDVRAEINTLINDNASGEISPLDVRTCLIDIVDSGVQDESYIFGDVPDQPFALTGAYQSIGTLYTTGVPAVPGFVTPNSGAGTITLSATAGFTYSIKTQITLSTSNNEEVDFRIGINGVPVGYVGSIIGSAGGRELSVSVEYILLAAGVSDVITLMARAADGSGTMSVDSIFLFAAILPTNNP